MVWLCLVQIINIKNQIDMKRINYKSKGEHSVNELEKIIEQREEELHLIKSGQQALNIGGVSNHRELLIDFADGINIHDGDRKKIGKLVDIYLKINS